MNARDWLRLLVLSLVWGGTFLFVSLALRGTPGFTLVFLRVALAAAGFWVFIVASGRRMPRDRKLWRQFLVSGLITNAIPFSLITWEQTQVEGGIAAVMNAMTPCFVVLLAHFFTKDEKATVQKAVGVLIGFLGAYVLLSPEIHGGVSMRGLGLIAGLTASVAHAAAGIYGKRFTGLSPIVAATGMLTGAAVWLLPVSLIVDRPWETVQPSLIAAGAVGALGLGTVIAYLLYYRILRSAGATNLMLATLLGPVWAHILGAVVIGERIYATSVAGALIIVIGLAIMDGRVLKRLRGGRPGAGETTVAT
jgi:drug/metabolite transporter (DMT)-like permease